MPQELPEVRLAVPADEDAVMAMCRRLHEENGLFTLNEAKVRACLKKSFSREKAIVGVIGPTDRLEASTCLMISDFYYTDDWHLGELWNFVEPEARRSRNAEALIEFGKSCAEKLGLPFFTGIITNRQMGGKVRLYRRLLGYPTGAFFVHNSKWKSEPMEDHGDLRQRLGEFARICNENKINNSNRRQLAELLREAREAIGGEDRVWGASKSGNGTAAHAAVDG